MKPVPTAQWIERCASRILQVDQEVDAVEARQLARELRRFERTGAMVPEAAVDFVASELARPNPRFERRLAPRD
jgi:hypothetical protein